MDSDELAEWSSAVSMEKGELEKVVAVNDLTDNKTLAHLFKYDSSQGIFDAEVSHDDESITINGHTIKASAERDPAPSCPGASWACRSGPRVDGVFRRSGGCGQAPRGRRQERC